MGSPWECPHCKSIRIKMDIPIGSWEVWGAACCNCGYHAVEDKFILWSACRTIEGEKHVKARKISS